MNEFNTGHSVLVVHWLWEAVAVLLIETLHVSFHKLTHSGPKSSSRFVHTNIGV